MYKPVLFVFCNMWNINNFRRYFVWEMHTAVGSFMWTGLLLCTNSIVSHRTQISNQVRIYSEVSWQYCSSEKMEVGQDIVNTNCSTAVVRKYIESVHESLFMIYLCELSSCQVSRVPVQDYVWDRVFDLAKCLLYMSICNILLPEKWGGSGRDYFSQISLSSNPAFCNICFSKKWRLQ